MRITKKLMILNLLIMLLLSACPLKAAHNSKNSWWSWRIAASLGASLAVIGGLVAYRYYQNTASDQNTVSAQDVWNQYERSKGDINAVKKFIGKKKIHHINREIKGVSLKKNWLSFLYTIVTCCCDTRI